MKPAFEHVVKQYINLVYYFALRHASRDEVDDIVSDTMMKAFKGYAAFDYRSDNQLKAWVLTICRNVITDRLKSQQPLFVDVGLIDTELSDTSITAIEDQMIDDEKITLAHQLIDKLDPSDQQIINLRIVETLSFKEIAAIYNVAEAAAKMKYYRAMEHVRAQL